MTSLDDALDARVGNTFGDTVKANAILTALYELGTADGDSVDDDQNAANLAFAILINQLTIQKAKTDSTLVKDIKTIEQMIKDIQPIPSQSEETTITDIIKYRQPDSSLHWSQG